MAKDNRFVRIHTDGALSTNEIWVDTETGVQYLYHQRGGDSAGLTVLLGPDGKPLLYRPED